MSVIYKYKLEFETVQHIQLPTDYTILHADHQGDDLFVWAKVAIVPLSNEGVPVRIVIYGTGHEMRSEHKRYISTVKMPNGLVFHVFEG